MQAGWKLRSRVTLDAIGDNSLTEWILSILKLNGDPTNLFRENFKDHFIFN